MSLRIKLITMILRRSKLLALLPVLVIYGMVPSVSLAKYFSSGAFHAGITFICATQLLIPLCSILWPMGYLHNWIEGDGCEVLRAYSKYHKSCAGDILLLYGTYQLLVFPIISFAVALFEVSWMEYVRLTLQISAVMSCFYFMALLFKNVAIGSIPVISYLFLCFYISGSSDWAPFSMLEPFCFAEESHWTTLICIQVVSLCLFLWGHLLDRFWQIY